MGVRYCTYSIELGSLVAKGDGELRDAYCKVKIKKFILKIVTSLSVLNVALPKPSGSQDSICHVDNDNDSDNRSDGKEKWNRGATGCNASTRFHPGQ